MRVVSLVPSVTETLAAWGADPIACTRFCERADLTHVGGTKNPTIDEIIALAPDLVIMDRQENRREDADALTAAGLTVVDLDICAVGDVPEQLAVLATAVGVAVPIMAVPEAVAATVTAFVPIWRRPWMTISDATYGSSLLATIGVGNAFAGAATAYPEVTLEEAAARRPDIVLVPSEPYAFADAHLRELQEVAPVQRVDGQDLFWWGARTPAAIERLRAVVHDR